MSNVVPLAVKRRIIQCEARIETLEALLSKWCAYMVQSGSVPSTVDENNPVHTLVRDMRAALSHDWRASSGNGESP